MDLQKLIEETNEFIKDREEYATENNDSPCAEFAATFGYGGADKDDVWREFLSNTTLNEDDIERLEAMELDDRIELLKAHATAEPGNIRSKANETYSVSIGEIEEELPEGLQAAIDDLSADDLEMFKRSIDGFYKNGHIYLDLNYSTWQAIVDIESLMEELGSSDNVTVVDFSKKNSNRPNEDSERIERLRNSLNILFNRRGLSNK